MVREWLDAPSPSTPAIATAQPRCLILHSLSSPGLPFLEPDYLSFIQVSLPSHYVMGRPLHLSGPYFSYLKNGDYNGKLPRRVVVRVK